VLVLRRCALAVSVLHDVDLRLGLTGIRLPGTPVVQVGWAEARRALATADPEGHEAYRRLHGWLTARRWIADSAPEKLTRTARPVALPPDAPVHPGADWAHRRVLGDALDVGLGFVGLDPARPDDVVIVPAGALQAAGVDTVRLWTAADAYLETMGRIAAARYDRDPTAPLRPLGDCDVLTLLAAQTFRAALVATTGGMRTVAVPMRTRGWLDLSRIDPAFALAAAAATEPDQRGFDRPVLLTRDEVTAARTGGRPAAAALADPAGRTEGLRPALFR